MRYTDAPTMADNAMTFRGNEIALLNGVYATFMPGAHGHNGSGCTPTCPLQGIETLSSTLRHEPSLRHGQDVHSRPAQTRAEINLVCNQWVNSQEAGAGIRAPVYLLGVRNRLTLCAFQYKPGRGRRASSPLLGPRQPLPGIRVHAVRRTGGIEKGYELADSVERNVYDECEREENPASDVAEDGGAIQVAEKSEILRRTLGRPSR